MSFYRLYETDKVKSIEMCEGLLEEANLDVAVRIGDVYAFIIHHHVSCGNHDKVSLIMPITIATGIIHIYSKKNYYISRVIVRVTALFGINSTSNAIEIARGEAECLIKLCPKQSIFQNYYCVCCIMPRHHLDDKHEQFNPSISLSFSSNLSDINSYPILAMLQSMVIK